jgi:hypothetical protein
MDLLREIFEKYEVEEPERILTFKELELDIDAISRTMYILKEHYDYHIEENEKDIANSINIGIKTLEYRKKLSFIAIKDIVEFYLNRPHVNNVFHLKFNLTQDNLKNEFTQGRYEMLVDNLNLDLISINKDIEIISLFNFEFGEYRKRLFDFK